MFSFLQPKEAKSSVPQSMIMNLYYKYRLQSLIGIFIGYAAYYIVRNNFAFIEAAHEKNDDDYKRNRVGR